MISLSTWIFTTDNCNLRCPYCFEGHINKTMSEEVWSATSEHFIKLIKNNVITRTHWRISGGEPLLVFDTWREFPPYMKKVLGNRFMAGTISNFTLLNDDMIRYFVENKIGCGVSLDGTVHSKIDINGNSTSKKVMENIEWFLDEGGRCNILTVLTDTNVETGEILELAKFVVKHDLPWQVNSDIFVMLGNDYIEQMYQDVIEAIEYLTKSGYNMKKFSFQFLRPCSSCTDGCQAGRRLLSIHTDGSIYPCQTCEGDPIANIMTCDNIVNALKRQTAYPIGYNYERPEACHPDRCTASFHCKGSCKLNMAPGDENPKCQLIRRIHQYFVSNGYYAH